MKTEANQLLVEEFSEQQLEAISGGQTQAGGQAQIGVVVNLQNVNLVIGEVVIRDVENIVVAAQALTCDSFQQVFVS